MKTVHSYIRKARMEQAQAARQAKYTEAEQSLSEALNSLRRAPESEFAHCLNSMAELRIAKGDPASAEPLLQQVFQIDEELLGPDHPTTTISLQ